MNSKKFIAIFAMLAVIATTVVFIGCEKKENPVVEQRKDALKRQKYLSLPENNEDVDQVVVKWGQHGVGHGCNKYCIPPGFWCWLWCEHANIMEDPGIFFDNLLDNESVRAVVTDPEPGNRDFPKRITLEFPNEWNNGTALAEFLGNENEFIVNEAIIEGEGSSLLGILGVEHPCVIKAGEYPMYMNGEGNYVVELMVDRISLDFNFWGTEIKLKIGDQDQLSSTYSGYSEFSEVSNRTGYVIYAEFLREWNDNPNAINIMNAILNQGGLDVNEDIIVDEDSYLFEVFPYPCVIRASRYPVYTEDNENFVICFAVEPL